MPQHRFGGAVLQLIDAMNHFGGKRYDRILVNGGIKEHAASMDGALGVDANVGRSELQHWRRTVQQPIRH